MKKYFLISFPLILNFSLVDVQVALRSNLIQKTILLKTSLSQTKLILSKKCLQLQDSGLSFIFLKQQYVLQQMTEIKLDGQGTNQAKDQQKIRPNLKAAIRLAQKQQQQIIHNLEQLHKKVPVPPIPYDQQKTQLQKYLDLSFHQRNKKILRSIKAELSYLPCFQVHSQNDMPRQVLAIMKRDIDMLIAVISKFVYPALYPKGSIIQTVSTPRKTVKILLKGEVAIFQPINYKSYKNCLKNTKNQIVRLEWLDKLIEIFIKTPEHFYEERKQSKEQILEVKFNPQQLESEVEYHLRKKLKPLSQDICKKILSHSGIITPTTPHRHTKTIHEPGRLICSQRQQYVVNQQKMLWHTTICLTEAYVLQLQYNIYKKAISLLNSDEQKQYIQIILRKFQMFEYFDAKQYVKKQYMIDKKREEEQLKKKEQDQQRRKELALNQQLLITRHIQPHQKIVVQNAQSQQSQTRSFKEKVDGSQQIDIQTYQIKYDSDIYLIISGEVTIIIDKIGETRLSQLQHASKIRTYQSHQILKLYSTDIFGFEQIGKISQYNLRYRINKNSKLLLLSQNIYIRHFSQIPGFRAFFKSIQSQRNVLVASILRKIQRNIENQQLKKYQSLSSIQTVDKKGQTNKRTLQQMSPRNTKNLIRKVEFIGRNQFDIIQNKLKDKLALEKQGKSSSISFKQMITSGKQLKDSLSFASIYKNHLPKNCEIVGDYIEVRDKNGILKRKKYIIEESNKNAQKQKQIFRKLGIISDQDRNNHNFNLINNRRSKYVLEDFQKQHKQMNRLRKISHSLPRLNYFYAKKEEILYKNIHKRD